MSSYTAPVNLHSKTAENGDAETKYSLKSGLAQMFKVIKWRGRQYEGKVKG